MKKPLPIGNDLFRVIREEGYYYIDKTLLIKDFIEFQGTVTLITRPRRFGKTLNMTMLREFFDITTDSRAIFDGLAIMDTEYASQINSRPVIFFTFKDCKEDNAESLLFSISTVILKEYEKYYRILKGNTDDGYHDFFMIFQKLRQRDIHRDLLKTSIEILEKTLSIYYQINPIVLIDEYDQPIISSFEYGYHEELKTFFSGFYGAALKSQEFMGQALLTGIQRVVKESIFSQLNNIRVYTVLEEEYSTYFGLTTNETEELLRFYGLTLDESVKQQYNGYIFGKTEIYNPWSLLYYADTGRLENYWINTSTNYLVRSSISDADELFQKNYSTLISDGIAEVSADISCSFIELKSNDTLWGLLINTGYVTVVERVDRYFVKVRIPNGEVRDEFLRIIAEHAYVQGRDLYMMFKRLWDGDMDGFLDVYRELVLSCTSYHDAKENAYHMLFLGMCLSLQGMYKITSNIESGYGRSDIRMESLSDGRPHILIEFKQGEAVETLKEVALKQILDNQYYAGLQGEVLCVGIAHDKKKCEMVHTLLNLV